MSKGSKRRPTNNKKFKQNFDSIKWSDRPSKFIGRKQARPRAHHIMLDIEPYKGVIDGQMITSRSKEREYLKRHNCEMVGDEKDHFFRHNGKTESNPTKDWRD